MEGVQTEDRSSVTLQDVKVFFTGAEKVPPMGFPRKPVLLFHHDSRAVLPTASTCSLNPFHMDQKMRIKSGSNPDSTRLTSFTCTSQPWIKPGRTLLPTLGQIRIKDGRLWSYVVRRLSKGTFGSLVGGVNTGYIFGSVQE